MLHRGVTLLLRPPLMGNCTLQPLLLRPGLVLPQPLLLLLPPLMGKVLAVVQVNVAGEDDEDQGQGQETAHSKERAPAGEHAPAHAEHVVGPLVHVHGAGCHGQVEQVMGVHGQVSWQEWSIRDRSRMRAHAQ